MSGRDVYLDRLRRELRRHFIVDPRLVEEARGHLDEAAERARNEGMSDNAANDAAIARFGPPEQVAAAYAADRTRVLHWAILAAASLAGAAVAYVDSQPNWDDTGVTAGALLIAAAICGLVAPRRPWLWALAVGLWIPLHAFVTAPSPGSAAMLVVLAFPFAGAYLGRLARRVVLHASA